MGNTFIENIYFKKVHPDDPGTIYVFLNNKTKEEIKIDKIIINDIEIEEGEMPKEIYWWTQIPNSILPNEIGNVLIKLKNGFLSPFDLKLKLNNGEVLVQKINKEIQHIKDYLVIGEPMDIAKTNSQSIKADAIFCGDKGIVIILRNGDYKSILDKVKNKWETKVENPGKINITVDLPLFFSYQIESVWSISTEEELFFKTNLRKREIIIEKDNCKIAEPILIKFKEETK